MCTNDQNVFGFYIEFPSMAYNMSYDISEEFLYDIEIFD